MWLYNIIGTIVIIFGVFGVYVIAYSICLRQLERRYNTLSYYDRLAKKELYEASSYIQVTIDTLISQDLDYSHPLIQTLQEINSCIDSPYTMSIKEIRSDISKIAKILNQRNICPGVDKKITSDLSKVDTACERNQIYNKSILMYEYIVHRIFYPLKRMFLIPNRQI